MDTSSTHFWGTDSSTKADRKWCRADRLYLEKTCQTRACTHSNRAANTVISTRKPWEKYNFAAHNVYIFSSPADSDMNFENTYYENFYQGFNAPTSVLGNRRCILNSFQLSICLNEGQMSLLSSLMSLQRRKICWGWFELLKKHCEVAGVFFVCMYDIEQEEVFGGDVGGWAMWFLLDCHKSSATGKSIWPRVCLFGSGRESK